MPEYLSPGVFIEEIPARLKAIEGVSTSTAGFVGPTERGPVAGFPSPFKATKEFDLKADPALVLVTSQSQFTRIFGHPLPLPKPGDSHDSGYLAYAVKAFFDNGGKRCYISRVVANPEVPQDLLSQIRLSQGVVIRLAKPAKADDTELFLTSLRSINKGKTLQLFKRAGGASAASGGRAIVPFAAEPKTEPFALADGDQFRVKIGNDDPVESNAVFATSAKIVGDAVTQAVNTSDKLLIRAGNTEQTVEFIAGLDADVSKLAAFLNEKLKGVQVFVDAGNLAIRTDRFGTGAKLEILGGSAASKLGFENPPGTFLSAEGEGNVEDVGRVTIPEIRNLFPTQPATFVIGDNGNGQLQIMSVASGGTVRIQVFDTPTGPETLKKLGLATTEGAGTASIALTIESYDSARNSITVPSHAITDALDPSEVYGFVTDASTERLMQPLKGPQFFARNPGSWGAELSVTISSSSYSPLPISLPGESGSVTVQVQATTGLYVGAIVEVDHGKAHGYMRSVNEIVAIQGNVITFKTPLSLPVGIGDLSATVGPAGSFIQLLEIDVTVDDRSGATPSESFKGLSWNRSNLRKHYANQINSRSSLVYVQPPGIDGLSGSESASLATQPTTPDGFALRLLGPAKNGLPLADEVGDAVYIGEDAGPGSRTGIQALKDADDIRIIAAPGKTTAAVQNELITQCSLLRYRFAVLDCELPQSGGSITSILTHRSLYDSSYAAYYAPWIGVQNGKDVDYLPPSGYIAGVYARVDNERGVHKAPANEIVRNSIGLQSYFTTGEQDILNPRGVNAIRRFDGRGIRVWGARTVSSDPEFRYVNVRRFLIFLEASIDRGTQYVVFEPNAPETWSRIVDSINAFLNTQWRSGALFGRRPDDAYYVRCDETTMTVDDIQNGRLICDIGVAIVRPAEFVIFRIEQLTGFANQS